MKGLINVEYDMRKLIARMKMSDDGRTRSSKRVTWIGSKRGQRTTPDAADKLMRGREHHFHIS